MQNLFKWFAFIGNFRERPSFSRRASVAVASVALFGAMMAGCTFLQPEFSADAVDDSAPTPAAEAAQVRTIAVDERPDSSQGIRPSNGATASVTESANEAVAQSETVSPDQQEGTSQAETVTDTADSGGAGPLNGILGDNVPQVSSPEDNEEGARRPQLSGASPLDIVAAQDQLLGGIYDDVLPSVVLIRISRNLGAQEERPEIPDIPGIPRDFFERSGGSGFVWDDQGHIITNHHVVTDADRLTVILPNRVEMEAEFVGSDPDSDLAVLKVDDPDGFLKAVTLGDSDQVYMGQMAVAMGNPFGQQFSITTGIISGIGRTIRSGHSPFSIPEVLQTDAPINPGNSGGPLLDRNGHVIGVNTQIISRAGVNSGIGFAVPVNIARQVVPSLIKDGEYHYSWLGISGTSLFPDVAEAMDLPRRTTGALVIDVVRDGPADDAGLEASEDTLELEGLELPMGGDVIVSIDGTPVETIDDVIAYLVANTRPDQQVTMDIIRNGNPEKITVELGQRPGS